MSLQKNAGSEGLYIYDPNGEVGKISRRNIKAMNPEKKERVLEQLLEAREREKPIFSDSAHYDVDGKYFINLHNGTYRGNALRAAERYGDIVKKIYDPEKPVLLRGNKAKALFSNKLAVMQEAYKKTKNKNILNDINRLSDISKKHDKIVAIAL
jgi:hypothetical protein